MITIFGKPLLLLYGQLTLGLINGAFYALLSLGLAIIFGLLNIINFAHGALFMLGAVVAWMLLQPNGWLPEDWTPFGMPLHWNLQVSEQISVTYWSALLVAPLIVGAFGVVLEKTLINRLYKLDHLYGLLLTFGCALIIEGLVRNGFGSSGVPYAIPEALRGPLNLGFMMLPAYRAWVVVVAAVVCLLTWLVIEKTRIGSTLRAATENAALVQAFGINVPLLVTLTYGAGVALAAFAGVLAAPIYSVNPNMGSNLIIAVFAVVVIGGMGSILGSIVTGFALGILEGLAKVYYPQASATVVFVVMIVVLLARPAGLFGRA